jgi:hypothetical protein
MKWKWIAIWTVTLSGLPSTGLNSIDRTSYSFIHFLHGQRIPDPFPTVSKATYVYGRSNAGTRGSAEFVFYGFHKSIDEVYAASTIELSRHRIEISKQPVPKPNSIWFFNLNQGHGILCPSPSNLKRFRTVLILFATSGRSILQPGPPRAAVLRQ